MYFRVAEADKQNRVDNPYNEIELTTNIDVLGGLHFFLFTRYLLHMLLSGLLSGLSCLKQSSSERSHLKYDVFCTLKPGVFFCLFTKHHIPGPSLVQFSCAAHCSAILAEQRYLSRAALCGAVRCSCALRCCAVLCCAACVAVLRALLCCVRCCAACVAVLRALLCLLFRTCQLSIDEASHNSTAAPIQQSSAVRCHAVPCPAVRYCTVLRAVQYLFFLTCQVSFGGVISYSRSRGTPHQVCTPYIVKSHTKHSQLSSAQL